MSTEQTSAGKVVLGVVGAIVLASIGNTVVSLVAQQVGADASANPGLSAPFYVTLTTVGVVIAALAWSSIRKRAKDPRRTLGKLVPIVVGLSFLLDVPLFFQPNANPVGIIALMLMHVVVAAAAVPIFHRVLPLRTAVPA